MMKKITLLALIVPSLWASDHSFTGNIETRHARVTEEHASEWSNSLPCRHHLFGSWCGWRKRLADCGITSTATYTSDSLGNPIGGLQKGFAYTDSWGIDFKFDLEKMAGLCGVEFYMNWGVRGGSNLARKIGNQFPPAQVYGNQTIWLDNLYLQKTLWNNRLRIRAGRLQAGDTFLQNPLYYQYVSNAFCGNPIAVFFNGVFSAYPNAQWGVYSDLKVTQKVLTKIAVFNTNPNTGKPKYHGMDFSFNNRDGAQIISETSYLLNQGPCDRGLPGNYKLGTFFYTGTFTKYLGGKTRGNYGIYAMLDQMVYRNDYQWIRPFVALLFAPENRNLFPFFFTSGIVTKGLMPGRCQDQSAIGVAYGSYSSDLRKSQRIDGSDTQNFEMVIELNHQFKLNPWFFIQPDIQYIIHPKGYKHIKNALVLGAQVGITF